MIPNFEFVFVYVSTYFFIALYCAVIFSRVSYDIGRQLEIRYFRFELIALFLYCIFESLWALGHYGVVPALNTISIPLSVINHILVGCFCFFWFMYLECYLQSEFMSNKTWQIIAAIPFAVFVLLTVSTLFNGLVFYTGPNGVVERGPAYIVTVVLFFAYAAITAIRALYASFKAENKHRRTELITMSTFVLPPVVVGIVDTLVPLMPIVAPAFFFAFLVVFTMLQDGQISTDQLTHLNNRRRADKHLEFMRANATPQKPYLLFIIDVDSFKEINDGFGHLEGDNALCVVAATLRDACRNSSAFIGRWGGDEFIIMVPEDDVNSPEDFTNLIEHCLAYEAYERHLPYALNVSVGHAYCTGSEVSKKKLIEQADRSMYEAKGRTK